MLDQEILDGFREESKGLLKELNEVVETLEDVESEDEFPAAVLEDFSQKIDRMMGAAKTLGMEDPDHIGLQKMGKIAELCKLLGYSAAKSKRSAMVPIFAGFWADTIEVIDQLLGALEDQKKSEEIANSFTSVLQKRLEWLSNQFKAHEKTTMSSADGALPAEEKGEDKGGSTQIEVDALLADLGL